MKQLKISKNYYNSSRYFQTKYGKLKYMSESGNKYKTDKGSVLMFTEEDDSENDGGMFGWVKNVTKSIWNACKKKLVQFVLSMSTMGIGGIPMALDTILGILDMLPGFDRKPFDEKIAGFSSFAVEGAEGIEAVIKNIPVVGFFLEEDAEAAKNVVRFLVFTVNVAGGQYPAENVNIVKMQAASTAVGIAIATWGLMIAGTAGTLGAGGPFIKLLLEFGIDISNTAFSWVSGDVEAFEKWAKEQGRDLKEMGKRILDGTAKVPKKDANKDGEDKNKDNKDNKDNEKKTGEVATQDAQKNADSNDGNGEQQKMAAESTKKLNVSKERFIQSKYFTNKYGNLKYVSESGNKYMTDKGNVLMFVD